MISRTRFLITAACLCHLLLSPYLVTSQLLAAQNRPENSQSATPVPAPLPREENVTISAMDSQEKDGPIYKLRGHVEIHYGTYILYADEVTFNSDTGEAVGDGHMVLDGGPNDEHIEASHGTYNIRSQSGKFYDVVGTIGVRVKGTATVLTSSSPFAFAGKVVEKTGPDHFVVNDGSVTTCEMPHPNWTFAARKVVVDVGANATVYRSSFRIHGVPVFYFPFAAFPAHPLGRKSGFLIPNLGRSSTKGTIVGESVYWAINPSMDTTIGAEYFSFRGWAPRGEFRARPSENSYLDATYFGVLDRGFGSPKTDQGGQEIHLNGDNTFSTGLR